MYYFIQEETKKRLKFLMRTLFETGFILEDEDGKGAHIWYNGYEYVVTGDKEPVGMITRERARDYCLLGAVWPDRVVLE